MRRLILVAATGVAGVVGLLAVWVKYTRIGAGFANDVVNPFLVRRGIAGSSASELGTLEHVGRRTGTRHLTPIHPVATEDGFRIAVPLGERSEWARNVLAAGHCRMQLHGSIHELDQPVLLAAGELPEIFAPAAWILDRLDCRYLLLRRFAEHPGSLGPGDEAPVEAAPTAESPQVAVG